MVDYTGTSGDDDYSGTTGDDRIFGLGGDDNLWGNDGHDIIRAGGGRDIVSDSAGADLLDGGNGLDTLVISYLSFFDTQPPITFTFDPDAGPVTTRFGGTAINFEQINFTGGSSDDDITGGAHDDLLRGWFGNDVLHGGAGDDFLIGDSGDDQEFGGDGDDLVTGNGGSDYLVGGNGDDTLIGGRPGDTVQGHDILEGGRGADHFMGGLGQTDISFIHASSGVDVDFVQGIGTRGEAAGDTYGDGGGFFPLHGQVLGSDFGDTIIGYNEQFGRGGNDTLIAGTTTRLMTGGDGRDTFGFRFDYHVINDGVTIADFDQSLHEKIDLSAIDTKPQAAGDQKFHFLGTDDFINDKPGQVRYQVIGEQTFITMTLDGRSGADATIVLDGVYTLTAHDFIL